MSLQLRAAFTLHTSTSVYIGTSTSVTACRRRPSPPVDDVWCWIDVICANILLNVIQHHHLCHQEVGRRTGQSFSTVVCYSLLRDIEFKNERQCRQRCTRRRRFCVNDVVKNRDQLREYERLVQEVCT